MDSMSTEVGGPARVLQAADPRIRRHLARDYAAQASSGGSDPSGAADSAGIPLPVAAMASRSTSTAVARITPSSGG